jgi:hypothetical protein
LGKQSSFGYCALKNGSNIQLGIGLHEDMQHPQFVGWTIGNFLLGTTLFSQPSI